MNVNTYINSLNLNPIFYINGYRREAKLIFELSRWNYADTQYEFPEVAYKVAEFHTYKNLPRPDEAHALLGESTLYVEAASAAIEDMKKAINFVLWGFKIRERI